MHHIDEMFFLTGFSSLSIPAPGPFSSNVRFTDQFFRQFGLVFYGAFTDTEFGKVSIKVTLLKKAKTFIQNGLVTAFNCFFFYFGQLAYFMLYVGDLHFSGTRHASCVFQRSALLDPIHDKIGFF